MSQYEDYVYQQGGYLLKRYIVYFYNRFSQEYQTFNVIAKNKYRAGRLFYLKHNRKFFCKGCIESITEAESERYWTEEEIRESINYK